MSNGIRKYEPDTDWFEDSERLDVRAVMGSQRIAPEGEDPDEWDGNGRSVQLTIGNEVTILTEQQTLDLIGVLSKRLSCSDGFSATAVKDEKTVNPDGTKEVKETSW